MKKLTLTADLYHDFVYGAVALRKPANLKELGTAMRVLELLEERGEPDPDTGNHRLKTATATFELEDAHAEFIARCLEDAVPSIPVFRARELLPLIEQLRAPNGDSPKTRRRK